MNLFKILLPLLFLSFFVPKVQATHMLGGEITWDCDTNGNYIFKARLYQDCNGVQWNYQSLNMDIIGNPLPTNANNNSFSSILMKPDTNRWVNSNFGDISPECSAGPNSISCSNSASGSVRQYFYQSDPIHITNNPPASGWRFNITIACCRPNLSNLSAAGSMLLRAIMYQNGNNGCFDASPDFTQDPQYAFCRGQLSTVDYSATDVNGDSLSYSYDRPYNAPYTAPQPVPFSQGYSPTNPLPDGSFDPNNISASLNPSNGLMDFKVNNGNAIQNFAMVMRVDSWRNGLLMASIFREIPIVIFNCPQLPNNTANTPPTINPPFYKGGTTYSFADSITVGQSIRVNLGVLDSNLYNQNLQDIRIELRGSSLSKDLRTPTNCPDPSDVNCAILNSPPLIDSNNYEYYYQSTGGWGAQMNWQTDCGDLSASGGARTHYFYITAKDDFCPIPATTKKVIAITVLPDSTVCPNIQTSIAEAVHLKDQLKVYPNPNHGQIFIENPAGESLDYQIFDLKGKLIERSKLRAFQKVIELPENSGIYLLKVINPQGEQAHYKLIRK